MLAESRAEGTAEPAAECSSRKKIKKGVLGPKRVGLQMQTWGQSLYSMYNGLFDLSPQPPVQLSGQYPEDDPDYSMWLPPAGKLQQITFACSILV